MHTHSQVSNLTLLLLFSIDFAIKRDEVDRQTIERWYELGKFKKWVMNCGESLIPDD